jgi:hypothetical protein
MAASGQKRSPDQIAKRWFAGIHQRSAFCLGQVSDARYPPICEIRALQFQVVLDPTASQVERVWNRYISRFHK